LSNALSFAYVLHGSSVAKHSYRLLRAGSRRRQASITFDVGAGMPVWQRNRNKPLANHFVEEVSMTDNREPIKLAPIARYRIHRSNGDGTGKVWYCDDRSEAITLAAELGGTVECYVYGIGYENINKVMEAEE
jgi:hypothetical protein